VPSKVYTIMASGRPVVAAVDPGSDAWNLVEQAQCGLCIEPENPHALAEAIRTLYADPHPAGAPGPQRPGARHPALHPPGRGTTVSRAVDFAGGPGLKAAIGHPHTARAITPGDSPAAERIVSIILEHLS